MTGNITPLMELIGLVVIAATLTTVMVVVMWAINKWG